MCSCGCELAMVMVQKSLDAEADGRNNQEMLSRSRPGSFLPPTRSRWLTRLIACFVPERRAAR
jgi:hypothetical protein